MAQHQQPAHSGAAITSLKVQPYQSGAVVLTSPAVDADGWLSADHSQTGDETSPALSWSGPLEVTTWALVVEDPDAPRDQPTLHWLVWNIPGAWTDLRAGLAKTACPEGGDGLVQGLNSHGSHGWLGMAPPQGHGPHRYYFQIFGLDRVLDLPVDTPLAEFVNVLKGAAIARGELVGMFENPDPLLDAPSPARTGSYGRDEGEPRPPTDAEREAGRGGLDHDDPDRHAPHDPDGVVRPG
ncbi:YbhB/YbcL family Raf kinase inhibitor-like protein [Roseibacterium beibuensis]|uniref:YbhB/YbcL family Raf kinase inhibitor-like protein n=1 Tax=[Roseibacterium] beibuensis TaxID=1193142 RepID=UPI00217DEEFC|nr:YbhB/YbcL family Raf kinase inhibitor-like protein [Roseibacterium beibuensis]MCS6622826.1 YbhB/YbcL family Raf kinase inhibitor-like protein [Roseibacterium beibuensis]